MIRKKILKNDSNKQSVWRAKLFLYSPVQRSVKNSFNKKIVNVLYLFTLNFKYTKIDITLKLNSITSSNKIVGKG